MRSAEKWCEEEMNASGEDKRTLVVGLGVTGLSVARFLASRGDEALVIDSRARPPGLEALRQDQPQILLSRCGGRKVPTHVFRWLFVPSFR